MKLATLYSRSTGLEIRDQFLVEKYFPLPFEKYITLQASSGMPAKNYPYFQEVFNVLGPILAQNGIKIVQIGGDKDTPINGCEHYMGKTNLHQTNYILKNTILHISNDSWSCHRVGELGRPLIELFGPTTAENHGPYKYNIDKTRFLTAHRWNRNPSFSPQESQSSIATIPPEDVINAFFELIGSPMRYNRKSLFFGENFLQPTIEWVPDCVIDPNFMPGAGFAARMDYHFDENNLIQTLQSRPLHICTDKPINIDILKQFKNKIVGLNFEITEETPIQYIKDLKRVGLKLATYTKISDLVKLSALRLKFFDITQVHLATVNNYENFLNQTSKYLNLSIDKISSIISNCKNAVYRSNKFILSDGKIYLSKSAWKKNEPTSSFEQNIQSIGIKLIDPFFWEESQHFYIFEEPINK